MLLQLHVCYHERAQPSTIFQEELGELAAKQRLRARDLQNDIKSNGATPLLQSIRALSLYRPPSHLVYEQETRQ
jgi:hypothetical protein